MANKKFTPEEMSELRKSKYVLDVSPSIVHFSAQFKKEFWNGLMQGKLPKDIVQSLGINPKILGEIRLSGLKTMIRNEVKKGDGFRDLNTYMQAGNGTSVRKLFDCFPSKAKNIVHIQPFNQRVKLRYPLAMKTKCNLNCNNPISHGNVTQKPNRQPIPKSNVL